ncbi:MAG: PEP-CTERM sorting domain-containing protein [Rubrivivax sp.]|nr:MAG: PEP-CTERM sorting domain-containing protein [Rubrivivax sp.]
MKKLIAALVTSASALAAQADVTLNAGVTGLTFELVDLDPSDGIAPAITYLSAANQRQNGWLTISPLNGVRESDNVFSPAFRSESRSISNSGQTASFEFGGDTSEAPLSIESYAFTSADSSLEIGYDHVRSQAQLQLLFSLTPMTQLNAVASGNIEVDSFLTMAGKDSMWALANASIWANGLTKASSFITYSSRGRIDDISYGNHQSLSISLINFSNQANSWSFTAGAYTEVSDVPEPSSMLMLLFGLAALGARLSERRSVRPPLSADVPLSEDSQRSVGTVLRHLES